MIKSLKLTNFRAFPSYVVNFGASAFLVGPNNAGKSTILTALRTADVLIRYARARKSDRRVEDKGRNVPGYPILLRDFPSLLESIRHEFRNVEARMELTWESGARLIAVWPEETESDGFDPFFYLEHMPGLFTNTPKIAKEYYTLFGVVPALGPIEGTEPLLEDNYVISNVSGRLSSRHFRNQLRIAKHGGRLDSLLGLCSEWLPEVSIEQIGSHPGERQVELDVYYSEVGSRIHKEIAWAGDGIQVWLQILYHVDRLSALQTIVLDEPEVYLHPDLQRRLVQLLESTGKQIILATHSTEIVSEVDARNIVMVDKAQRRAKRVKAGSELQLLSEMLGTAFNVRLARGLRSKVVLFVEGDDMSILRRFANIVGCDAISKEKMISIVPLRGYSHWGKVEPFKWLIEDLFPEALQIYVILDRDYRPAELVTSAEESFRRAGISVHIWKRKELESYVLNPITISRESGASVSEVTTWVDEITSEMSGEVFGRLLGALTEVERPKGIDPVTTASSFKPEFDRNWIDPAYRLRVCPPKQIIRGLNFRLQAAKKRTLSATTLARAHREDEIATEIKLVLRGIESLVTR